VTQGMIGSIETAHRRKRIGGSAAGAAAEGKPRADGRRLQLQVTPSRLVRRYSNGSLTAL
jgi:hypothetical protein